MPLKDKAARKRWAAQYYIKNKKKIKAYAQRYSAEHTAEQADNNRRNSRAYYHAHRDQALARRAAYTAEHCAAGSTCRSYKNMLQRCLNPNYSKFHRYGGRNITVAKRWTGKEGFVNFELDLGPRPSRKHQIHRLNNNGNYTPSNCVWSLNHSETVYSVRKLREVA
jgi:hypothetical protein